MAKKPYEARERKVKEAPTYDPANPIKFVGKHVFINPYLNEGDQQWLADNLDGYDSIVLEVIGLCEPAYSLRVAYDWTSNRFTAMLTCMVEHHPNTGFILSVRGATAADAIYSLYYIHEIKAEGLWRSVAPNTTHVSRFG